MTISRLIFTKQSILLSVIPTKVGIQFFLSCAYMLGTSNEANDLRRFEGPDQCLAKGPYNGRALRDAPCTDAVLSLIGLDGQQPWKGRPTCSA